MMALGIVGGLDSRARRGCGTASAEVIVGK